jgi:hypothetical protein
MGGLGGDEEKNMADDAGRRDDRVMDSIFAFGFDFWSIHLEILAD